MTVRRDLDALIRTYLEDGPTELADRSYEAIRAEVAQTQQRLSIGRWMLPNMLSYARYVIAGVVVLALIVGGAGLLSNRSGLIGPGASPAPSPAASASSQPATLAPLPLGAKLEPGTYVVDVIASRPQLSYSLTVPDGWFSFSGDFINTGTADPPIGASISIWDLTDVDIYRDPCPPPSVGFTLDPVKGRSPEDLATAFAAFEERLVIPPRDVEIDGYSGVLLEIQVPDDADFAACAFGEYRTWETTAGDQRYHQGPGQHDRLWILDVDGRRFVINTTFYTATPAATMVELDAIVDSVRIQP